MSDRATTTTVISLREYVDVRLEALEKGMNAAINAAQKAVDKAEVASERRFEGVNEFRAALNDNARLLMPRSEAEQIFNAMTEKIEVLNARINSREDRGAGMNQGWIILVAAIGVIGTIVAVILSIR